MSAAAKVPKASPAAAPPVTADALPGLLSRLRLTALRDRLDGLLDDANGRKPVRPFIGRFIDPDPDGPGP